MWLKNCWYAAKFSSSLAHELSKVVILSENVVLYRAETGEPVALADRCPHRGIPLSYGKLIGDQIRCGYHGMRIDADGGCVKIPCQAQIPAQARTRRYPAEERYGLVWLWMGDAEMADPELIPNFSYMNSPEWTTCVGYHYVEANYLLFNDNLLDLSHESYVHDDTIGNDAVAEAPAKMTRSAGEVRVHRDINDCEPPAFYIRATGFTSRINRWHTTIFRPPGNHIIENGSYPSQGLREHALQRRVMHIITPATETSSHYFWGVARQYQQDDEELTEYIREQIAKTFDQDKEILELQQRSLGTQGASLFPVALVTDVGPIQARRLVESLIKQEQAGSTCA